MYTYQPKVNCPYCGSIQVKRMPAQPNKYPRPSDPAFLLDWQNGYDCKKCGSEFVINQNIPYKKNSRIFSKLISIIVVFTILYFGYHLFFSKNDLVNNSSNIHQDSTNQQLNVAEQELAPMSPEAKQQKSDSKNPSSEEFSKDAEIAAHSYIPTTEDHKRLEQQKQESIANSKDPNQTLHISTTIRSND